jgi:hypothetical protein
MWELVESIIYFFKYKKWPLPFFIVVILIIISFIWSAYDPAEKVKQESITPASIGVKEQENFPTYSYPQKDPKPNLNGKAEHKSREDKPVEKEQQEGNITHFKDSLIDALKVEGLDPTIAEKIFTHMRAQLGRKEGSLYDVEESIRIALGPDADDLEVDRIRELVSQVADESSNYHK